MRVIKVIDIPSSVAFTVDVPKGAEFLSVRNQASKLKLWIISDSGEKQTEKWSFQVLGKGNTVPDNAVFVGQIQMDGVKNVFRE